MWTEEANWEPLWQAVVEVSERRLANAPQRPYFMGAIVLANLQGALGAVPSREIIDGQQRTATLQILMQAAKTALAEFPTSVQLLERVTRNILGAGTDFQFKFWPTNTDRIPFRQVMTGQPSSGPMHEALGYFGTALKQWVGDGEDREVRANSLVSGLTSDLVFVVVDLDNDDDGQLIFETLNSLGTPLLPSDLVKNLLFREAQATGLDAEELYAAHWQMFESDAAYWGAMVRIGRRDRPRLDVFLQYYLTYKLRKEPMMAHHFRDYRDAFRDGKFGSTEEALADFALHSQWFLEFDVAKEGAAGSLRHVLDILDASVPRPLILGIYANVKDPAERDSMLSILESYLIRRFLCAVSTKNYNKIVADLIAKMADDGWTSESLRQALLAYEGNSSIWPDDEFVRWRTCQRDAYGDIRGVGIGYVLARVEASLRSEKSELTWNPRTPLTIEHLMPRRWEEHWPLPSPDDEIAKNRRNDLLDRIGNLTVLTRKLNISISNGAWGVKREHLQQHSVLLINSNLITRETWDEEAIEGRSLELADQFCRLWPR